MHIIKHASYDKNDVEITAREMCFRGFVKVEKISFRHRLFQQEGYSPVIQRELIQRGQAAGVLLYNDRQQRFALIEQCRVGALDDEASPWQLEVIAGVLDGDESPESCIRRESLEESGCDVEELTHLFSFYPSAGACSEIFHLYAAETNLPEQGGIFGLAEEGENILFHLFSYAEINTLLYNGRLRNAPVIMALQWLQQHVQVSQTT
ncbi:MAG: NUDIX domain-containing protein [Acinetobacter sp.]